MKSVHITVTGLVQGVGYRPFVAELAEELGLVGEVKNSGGVVEIDATGEEASIRQFAERLSSSAPEGAQVERVLEEASAKQPRRLERGIPAIQSCGAKFSIVESSDRQDILRLLPPDLSVCENCQRELHDPGNRRYHYPFISCVSCGPRFSIMQNIPYDRDSITMKIFPMCENCAKEYREKGNRRRHAQTIACHECGPQLKAVGGNLQGEIIFQEEKESVGIGKSCIGDPHVLAEKEVAFQLAIKVLSQGGIVAVKDIGGFHFACLPHDSKALQRLREFKNREKKPFAVLFPDMESVKEYCKVNRQEEALLTSNSKPIVLLDKKKDFAPEVCADSDRIGAMLPCNPLQILLAQETGPLVMTSGNRGGEPIIIHDKEMEALFEKGCPDLILTHDREILTPLEDSVCQVTGVGISMLRRGRGYVPEPVWLSRNFKEECFAAGGDLKAVFALGKKNAAYLGSHFGDLEDFRCMTARKKSALHMAEILQIVPESSTADLHPGYRSAKEPIFHVRDVKNVQHHHAHILSVMAEHGLEGPVLGVAFDGTGYGPDGGIWGGEFLLCRENKMERVGCLSPVMMAGGDAASREAGISLWCYLLTAKERGLLSQAELARAGELSYLKSKKELHDTIEAARRAEINTYACSSVGRLFDAVSALLGICDYNHYEGECAILLEQEARRALRTQDVGMTLSVSKIGNTSLQDKNNMPERRVQNRYEKDRHDAPMFPPEIGKKDGIWQIDGVKFLAELFAARQQGADRAKLALAFHRWLVAAIRELALKIRKEQGITDIALSGGTFCNRILLEETVDVLQNCGFQVYRNEVVPCGDGGIALGQIYALTF